MKTSTVDILLSIGIPAGVKGFNYICDAMKSSIAIRIMRTEKSVHYITTLLKNTTLLHPGSSALCVTHLKPPFSKVPRKK